MTEAEEPPPTPPVSDEVRGLISDGKPREALRRHQKETGADMVDAMAQLAEAAKQLRRE